MKSLKVALILLVIPLCLSFTAHKFYVSITKVDYVPEEQSLQIITKLFIEDIEEVLKARYTAEVSLDPEKETPRDAMFLKEYVVKKLEIKVDGQPVVFNYIGHDYDNDVVKTYIEVVDVSAFQRIEVTNSMLTELFEEQQNIVHVKLGKKRKTLVLDRENPKGVLNFD